MITFLEIGSYVFPAPTKFSCNYEDLDSEKTTRNERGVLANRDRLRADMFTISASYRIKISELSNMASALKPKIFTAKVFDLTSGGVVQKKMYASSKHAEIVLVNQNNATETWVDYSFNLIEC